MGKGLKNLDLLSCELLYKFRGLSAIVSSGRVIALVDEEENKDE